MVFSPCNVKPVLLLSCFGFVTWFQLELPFWCLAKSFQIAGIGYQSTGLSLVQLKKELEQYSLPYLGKEKQRSVCWVKSNSISCRSCRAAFCKTVIGCLCLLTLVFCVILNKSKIIWVQKGSWDYYYYL